MKIFTKLDFFILNHFCSIAFLDHFIATLSQKQLLSFRRLKMCITPNLRHLRFSGLSRKQALKISDEEVIKLFNELVHITAIICPVRRFFDCTLDYLFSFHTLPITNL